MQRNNSTSGHCTSNYVQPCKFNIEVKSKIYHIGPTYISVSTEWRSVIQNLQILHDVQHHKGTDMYVCNETEAYFVYAKIDWIHVTIGWK
jgi:hypothetical protein